MSQQVTVIVDGREYVVEVGDLSERPIRATVNQKTYQVQAPGPAAQPAKPAAPVQRTAPPAAPAPAVQAAAPSAPAASGSAITAPMPGDILEVKVKPGDQVNPGDVVCVLEAMKMKNMIRTSRGGVVASVEVSSGQAVDYGAVLVVFE